MALPKPSLRTALTAAAAAASGALWSLAFAPASLGAPAFAGLLAGMALAAESPGVRRPALLIFLFAFSAFLPGLDWTVRSMHEFGRLALPLAWTGAALLAVVCALFWTAAAAAAAFFEPGPRRWAALALALTAAEWLRGAGGVDFGWLTPAFGTLGTPLAALAPLGGTHGVNLAVFAALAGIGAAASGLLRRRPAASVALLMPAAVLAAAFWSGAREWSAPGPEIEVRLVQADLPVVDGWTRPDSPARLEAVAAQMRRPWPEGAAPRAALTPEGILSGDSLRPSPRLDAALTHFADAAGAPVLFNGFRRGEPGEWFNTGFFAGPSGGVAVTDKRKLVPFGEFVPAAFRWFVDLMGIPLADLSPGAADQPNLEISEGVRAGLLICYENLDGEVLRSFWRDPKGGPQVLFVTASLGWFAPEVIGQHLDMTRFLALASARPAASVNMNGRSALIDAEGRVVAEAAASGPDLLTARFATADGPATPFVRFGDLPAGVLWLAAAMALAALRVRRRG